jgi:hypothetical protein
MLTLAWTEKVSHENQDPVETWKLDPGPLDAHCTGEIRNQHGPNFLQISARLLLVCLHKPPIVYSFFINQGTGPGTVPLLCFLERDSLSIMALNFQCFLYQQKIHI